MKFQAMPLQVELFLKFLVKGFFCVSCSLRILRRLQTLAENCGRKRRPEKGLERKTPGKLPSPSNFSEHYYLEKQSLSLSWRNSLFFGCCFLLVFRIPLSSFPVFTTDINCSGEIFPVEYNATWEWRDCSTRTMNFSFILRLCSQQKEGESLEGIAFAKNKLSWQRCLNPSWLDIFLHNRETFLSVFRLPFSFVSLPDSLIRKWSTNSMKDVLISHRMSFNWIR